MTRAPGGYRVLVAAEQEPAQQTLIVPGGVSAGAESERDRRPSGDERAEPVGDEQDRDGAIRDGAVRDGPVRDEPGRDEPGRAGPVRDGPVRDGAPPEEIVGVPDQSPGTPGQLLGMGEG